MKKHIITTGHYVRALGIAMSVLALTNQGIAATTNTVAVGTGAKATNSYDVAVGSGAVAAGNGAATNMATAIGSGAQANNAGAIAIGDASNGGVKASGRDSVAIGTGAAASADDTVALGSQAVATQTNATALGNNSNASGVSSMAVGDGARASNIYATAVGYNANASGSNTLALGANATASGSLTANGAPGSGFAIAIGSKANSAGSSSMAIGGNALATVTKALALGDTAHATAERAIAIGADANGSAYGVVALGMASNASKTNAVAIGNGARAAANVGDVALGAGATTSAVAATQNVTVGGNTYAVAGGNPNSTVSVGASGNERSITNVAAGRVSATSTDAVNGSELYATNQQVNINTSNIASNTTAIDNLTNGKAGPFVSDNSVNATQPVSSGADATAGGFGASATGAASTVIGNGATDNGNASATVLGQGASIATGVSGSNVALGQGSTVTSAAVPATGDTINGVAYSYAGAAPNGVVSVGTLTAPRQVTNVAAGQINAGSTDAVNGSQLYATDQAVTNVANQVSSLGGQVTSVGSLISNLGNSMATSLGGGSVYNVATGVLTTSLNYGGKTYGSVQNVLDQINTSVEDVAKQTSANTTAISNLQTGGNAASGTGSSTGGSGSASNSGNGSGQGTVGANAATVSQLNDVQAGSVQYARNSDGSVDYGNVTLDPNGSPAQIHNVAAGTAATDAANVGQVNAGIQTAENWAKNYVDQKLQNVAQAVNTVAVRANAGVASAMAMAGLPQAYQPNQNAAAVAFGSFHGQAGIAVGVSTVSETGRWVYKLNMSGNTRGDIGASVGAAVTW
jgi:autotransporter adhesin